MERKKVTKNSVVLALTMVVVCVCMHCSKFQLAGLQGDIVFTKRDKDIANIYVISANGKNKRKIFANNDAVNSNSMFPKWSEDKSQIYFVAMKNGKWQRWSVNKDGSDAKVIGDELPDSTVSHSSRANDIGVDRGNVYVKDSGGQTLIYASYVDGFYNAGVREASWSPDREYVIFETSSYLVGSHILISDKKGQNVVTLAEGEDPDWK